MVRMATNDTGSEWSRKVYERLAVQICARAALYYNVPVTGLVGNREWVKHSIDLPTDDTHGTLDAGIYTPGRGAGFFLCHDPGMVWRPTAKPHVLDTIPEKQWRRSRPRKRRDLNRDWDGPGIDETIRRCGGVIRQGKDIRTYCPVCARRTLDVHSENLTPGGAPVVKCWGECRSQDIYREIKRLGG